MHPRFSGGSYAKCWLRQHWPYSNGSMMRSFNRNYQMLHLTKRVTSNACFVNDQCNYCTQSTFKFSMFTNDKAMHIMLNGSTKLYNWVIVHKFKFPFPDFSSVTSPAIILQHSLKIFYTAALNKHDPLGINYELLEACWSRLNMTYPTLLYNICLQSKNTTKSNWTNQNPPLSCGSDQKWMNIEYLNWCFVILFNASLWN